jgi:two-component system, OmpR family, KDP operon response regulator KdpE
VRARLRALIESWRFDYVEAATGALAILEARGRAFDLVLVDLDLADRDGSTLIRRLRSSTPCPIMVISACAAEHGKIAALNAGADDYLSKPFSAQELRARLRAVLRRSCRAAEATYGVLTMGDVRVDLARRSARDRRGWIHLTRLEYRVLECLARQSGFIVPHARLVEEIWGPGHKGDTQSLRVCISNLRKKLERDPRRPRFLTTEPGIGYRLRLHTRSS